MQRRAKRLSKTASVKCEGCESNPASGICIICEQYLCDNCVKVHKNVTSTRSHKVLSLAELSIQYTYIPHPFSPKTARLCDIHQGSELKFFCTTCQVLTCRDCTIVTHRVPEHVHKPIKDAADEYQSFLVKMLKMLDKKTSEVSKKIAKATEKRDKLDENFTKEKAAVQTASDEVRSEISKTEQDVLDELETESVERMSRLNTQTNDLECKLSAFMRTCNDIRKSLEFESGAQLLTSKNTYTKQIEKLLAEDIDIKVEENDLHVLPRVDKITSMFKPRRTVCLSQCTIGDGVEYLLHKRQSVDLSITTKDCMGRHIVSEHEVKAIHIKPDGSQKQMEVTDNDDGTYSVTLHGDIEGNHEIRVMIGDTPIPGPPFTVEVVKDLVKTIGQKGDGELQFNNIRGIAINKNGDIVAADKDNNRLQIIDTGGKCKNIIPMGRMFKPVDVAVLNDNTYLVIGDAWNSGVAMISPFDQTISYFGANEIDRARGIAICPATGLVYVISETWNVFAKVFTQKGEFVKSMKLKWSTPTCIKIDNEGRLFVCVNLDHNAAVYDNNGELLYRISEVGMSDGMLRNPIYLAFDKHGYLYISSDHKVQKFDWLGNFICRIDTIEDELKHPTGIALLDDLSVIVADNRNSCIKVFVQ
ncbi:E3 ubiquitin-protein ligase TRIM71-like [Saccoglossus kowalevskii]|uniref:Tripartite motif-containing protein 2-like n=1 Tax=Saccoglossus kowalevskii TaxID=10224 RepID=A0ABM0MVJ9_SACKO|nr:PREDICTED: tripartite motif-containing protein 2-like [Saccoglossus kowalevskii]